MVLKRNATSLVAALTLAPLALGSGMAAASTPPTWNTHSEQPTTYEPADRGRGDRHRGDRGRGQAETPTEEPQDEKKEKPKACPTELWTIPLEVEGLLCVLLLEKSEDEKAPEEGAPAPDAP